MPSWRFAAAILAVHACGGLALGIALGGGLLGGALGAALLWVGMAGALRYGLLRGRGALRAIELLGPDRLQMERRGESSCPAHAGSRRHVSRFGVGLTLRPGGRMGIFIAADMLDPEAMRALRLWALWGRVPDIAASGRPMRSALQTREN